MPPARRTGLQIQEPLVYVLMLKMLGLGVGDTERGLELRSTTAV